MGGEQYIRKHYTKSLNIVLEIAINLPNFREVKKKKDCSTLKHKIYL